MRRFFHQKRFTLLELLIVVGLIMFLAILAVPSISGFLRNRRLDAAGSLIQGVLNKARTRAIKDGERQVVLFYTHNTINTFTPPLVTSPPIIIPPPGTAAEMYGRMIALDQLGNNSGATWEVVDDVKLPDLTEFIPKTPFAVQFYPDGSCILLNATNIDWDLAAFRNDVTATPADLEVQQIGGIDYSCHVDILQASGRSRKKIWEKP
jgi:type II secretory pathway pseudopilin PulG